MSNWNSQTAYQRWELASLGDEQESNFRTMPPEIARLAQEMIEAKDQAVQQGYEEGYNEGLAKGIADGKDQALAEARAEQQALANQLTGLFDSYSVDLNTAREQIGEDLLKLSVEIAQAIVKTSLALNPELLLPLIDSALLELPTLELPASIHLHPEDAELLEQSMASQLKNDGWRILPDAAIERGGCTLNTASHALDLQLATRWHKLMTQMEIDQPISEP